MKVLVVTGSAHKEGTSALLASKFIEGAKESGHEIYRFDAAFCNVHPCIACDECHNTDDGCVFQDDMEKLNPYLLRADVVAFATPVYYYGMTAQIKTVIDRFYANDSVLHDYKKAVLLLTLGDNTMESAAGVITSFRGMSNYLRWERAGMIVAKDCLTVEDILKTDYPKKAYELGKNL